MISCDRELRPLNHTSPIPPLAHVSHARTTQGEIVEGDSNERDKCTCFPDVWSTRAFRRTDITATGCGRWLSKKNEAYDSPSVADDLTTGDLLGFPPCR
jgi:hypothetical protein